MVLSLHDCKTEGVGGGIQPPDEILNSMNLSVDSTLREKGFFNCVFVKKKKRLRKMVYWG